jgi:hypothetical protein
VLSHVQGSIMRIHLLAVLCFAGKTEQFEVHCQLAQLPNCTEAARLLGN